MTASTPKRRRAVPPQNGSRQGRPGSGLKNSLLGIDDVACWLGVEAGFIRRLIAERRIPFVKVGKYVRFDPDDVAGWIDTQRVQSETRRSPSRNF
jgi:excisionase family DNA binding protein